MVLYRGPPGECIKDGNWAENFGGWFVTADDSAASAATINSSDANGRGRFSLGEATSNKCIAVPKMRIIEISTTGSTVNAHG